MSQSREKLIRAAARKDDEFYTAMSDIEAELAHYDLSGKTVLCNCDTLQSSFCKYFSEAGRCKRLICTGLGNPRDSSDGDFRHELKALEEADVVVTNPPFSLIREFCALLLEHGKDFLIVGPLTLCQTIVLRSAVIQGRVHSGYQQHHHMKFTGEDGSCRQAPAIWYTTLPVDVPEWRTGVSFDEKTAVFTDDGALFIKRSAHIPDDYAGVMAVPLTFFQHMSLRQFDIHRISHKPTVNGKYTFSRIYIQNRSLGQDSSQERPETGYPLFL